MTDPFKVTKLDKLFVATVLKLFPPQVTPNQITIFRFFTVPFVAFFISIGEYKWAFILFVISAFSDALDGALARTTDRVTEWGTVYDPVADKLLIGFSIFLILPKFLDPRLAFTIIFLEMFMIGAGYYFRNFGQKQVLSNWWGKSKMLTQSVGVSLVLLYSILPFGFLILAAEYILYAAVGLALISLITYSL
ncbi:MAG: CDP-alcohol phosphatidyltransferase family protein [Candidatus Jorgensenbacteria bacterium]